jgi:RHS repeat-associated protein
VTAQGDLRFTYDALNMMTRAQSASIPAPHVEYIYTADDERIAVRDLATGGWRWTLRDASGKVLRELTSRNASDGSLGTASWTWTRDNVWRDSLLLASRQRDPHTSAITTYHYHLDHLGTPRQVTDDAKMIVGRHSYHPFGPTVPGGVNEPNPSNLNYTGHERDADIELDYMHARFYDGRVGRFLSVDPTWESADLGRPQSWNRYSYVLNNPINYTDPDGRCPIVLECVALGALGKAVFVVGTTLVVGAISETEVNGKPISTHVGEFLLSGGGSSGEMAAETMVRNYAAKQAEEAEPAELPARDSTGKVHGELPTPADLREHSTDDLKQFQEELKGSVGRRIDVTSQLGPDKAHGERQAAEQRLIKQIDKIIKDREPK